MSEITANPTAGKSYEVVRGDRITFISDRAYGSQSYAQNIVDANAFIKPRPKSEEKLPIIIGGDVLFIPVIPELERVKPQKKLSGKARNDITVVVNDIEIPTDSLSLVRTMDTGADGCAFSIAWEPYKDLKLDEATAPYGYKDAQVYIGGVLRLGGILYNVKRTSGKAGKSQDLGIFSYTADIVDSTVSTPYEKNNVTLLQRAREQCRPFGIDVVVDDGTDPGGIFKRVTAEPTETIFAHLSKLAAQRGCLISSTIDGQLLITSAKLDSDIVGTLEEGFPQSQDFEIEFNGRNRFKTYKSLSQTPKKTGSTGTAIDSVVTRARTLNFQADDSLSGEMISAAEWRKNKTLADSLAIPFPVAADDSYYDPQGNLWDVNKRVTIVSPTIGIEKGFTFLIKQVEYIKEDGGKTVVLSVVPPQVYTRGTVDEPWIKE